MKLTIGTGRQNFESLRLNNWFFLSVRKDMSFAFAGKDFLIRKGRKTDAR